MAPKIVRAEYSNYGSGSFLGWDAEGTRYVLKRWGGYQPVYIYSNGSYSENLGEISQRDLNAALSLPVC